MRPDWRVLSLLLVLFGLWAFFALAPDFGKPRPAELIPAQPGGAFERSQAKARTAGLVRSGRLTLVEGAEAFRRIDQADDLPALDLDAYAGEVIRWVRGPEPDDKVRPDLADLLEAGRVEMRRKGGLQPPNSRRPALGGSAGRREARSRCGPTGAALDQAFLMVSS
jgi:hypothetical protein